MLLLDRINKTFIDNPEIIYFAGHGESNEITLTNQFGDAYNITSAKDFLSFMEEKSSLYFANKTYDEPSVFVLFSCSTGKGEEKSIAAEISELSKSLVFAPSERIMVNKEGKHQVMTKSNKYDKYGKKGYWNVFFNGKLVDRLQGSDFPNGNAIQISQYLDGKSSEELIKNYQKVYKEKYE